MGSQLNPGDAARERRLLALALLAMAVVVVIDLTVDTSALLIQLLLVGPLIATVGASVRQNILVATLAVVVSIPLVAGTDAFGSDRHGVALGVLVVGSVLGVVMARLRVDRQRDAARLEAQYQVARIISDAQNFDEAIERVLAVIARALGRQVAQYWTMDKANGALRCIAHWHEDGFEAGSFKRRSAELTFEPGHGLPGEVWQSGRPAWLGDAVAAGVFYRTAEAQEAGLNGGMAFAVFAGDELIGVIEVFSRQVRERDPAIYKLTEALGRQLGEFIEGLRAQEEREQARRQLEAILSGVADAVTAQAPDGRLLFANQAAVTTLGFESTEELMNAPTTAIVDRFEILDEEGRDFPLEALPGRRALGGEDSAESVVRFRLRGTGEERWSAVKATPIRDDGGEVTMAINVIEDITAQKRVELSQRLLARSGAVLASSLDLDQLLVEIAEMVVPEIADWCAVDLAADGGRLERKALAHADPSVRRRAIEMSERYPPDPNAEIGVHHVIRTGQPELYPEIPEQMLRDGAQDEEHYEALMEIGMRSAIIVPMTTRGRTLGAMTFVSGPSGRRFDEQDVELAHELARRCATAIDNARLYTDRSYIARTLQQSLLPVELPDIPGIEVAARFRPTGEGNEVGGDFYDMFETGNRGWAVVMGDVCGKGPDAAAVTALARYTLRATAMRERVPSRSLAMLNEALLRQRDDRRFCTVAYAYLEKLDRGARAGVSSGGHPLPLLLRTDGTVEPVGSPGTLLGVVPDPSLEDQLVTLEPGDVLVFYTDGVIETRAGTDGVLDERRLAELVATCAGRGADAIAAKVEEAAVLTQGGKPRDDIAVLVLRVAE